MTFHVGQKVECVEGYDYCLTKGRIYEVTDTRFAPKWMNVNCCSQHAHMIGAGWQPRRFRPIVERKTDISIFTQMLTPHGVDA